MKPQPVPETARRHGEQSHPPTDRAGAKPPGPVVPAETSHGLPFWLPDDVWAKMDPHLPHRQPGARRVDDRRILSGIAHVLRSDCRWSDCPAGYGPPTTVYNRFVRWSGRRFWPRVTAILIETNVISRTALADRQPSPAFPRR
ncbi:transposase [Sphingomonas sp. Leaf4]|uniref:transposase n=1 Tax=Sphingomonas sp. Leaf4 TaxID=2876553 RepID=UPI003FA77D3D